MNIALTNFQPKFNILFDKFLFILNINNMYAIKNLYVLNFITFTYTLKIPTIKVGFEPYLQSKLRQVNVQILLSLKYRIR